MAHMGSYSREQRQNIAHQVNFLPELEHVYLRETKALFENGTPIKFGPIGNTALLTGRPYYKVSYAITDA